VKNYMVSTLWSCDNLSDTPVVFPCLIWQKSPNCVIQTTRQLQIVNSQIILSQLPISSKWCSHPPVQQPSQALFCVPHNLTFFIVPHSIALAIISLIKCNLQKIFTFLVFKRSGNVGMFDNFLFDNSNGFSSTLFWTTFY
jgi:hypothetical protein